MTRVKWASAMVVSLSIFACQVFASPMADSTVRTVQGKVVAVNTMDAPQVIVVSVLIKNNQELIVGATVGAEADMTKDGRPVSLHDMKAGDNVTLT